MALFVDNQTTNSALKHFCRICKKGFGCGRALGGHMRAHGIGGDDSSGNHIEDDDDDNDDWPDDDKEAAEDEVAPSNKRMYALRTNPNNRLRSSRACENCGKEFLSWKSFLEHGKCVSDDADSLVSSSPPDSGGGGGGNWSKRKRSFRAKVGNPNPVSQMANSQICPSREEEDLANCLMMLSNAAVDPAAEPEESCASASRDELDHQQRRNSNINTTVPLSHFNISPVSFRVPDNNNNNNNNNNKILGKGVISGNNNNNNNKGLFECKACKKVFNSHQALGGHRASHKKVKGCFAARLDNTHDETLSAAAAEEDTSAALHDDPQSFPDTNNNNLNSSALIAAEHVGPAKRKSKVHECSICHRIFSSGQALGGHKRCHWLTSNSVAAAGVVSSAGPGAEATAALAKFQQFQESIDHINLAAAAAAAAAAVEAQHHANNNIKAAAPASALDLKLDLNLPANNNEVVSTEIFLKPWIGSSSGTKHEDQDRENRILSDVEDVIIDEADQCNVNKSITVNNNVMISTVIEDEADSKAKLAKLSELKDMNVSEGSSWLQVGIGSTTNVGSTVP